MPQVLLLSPFFLLLFCLFVFVCLFGGGLLVFFGVLFCFPSKHFAFRRHHFL